MAKFETLHDGLIDERKDLYSAENQLVKALPKMAKKATNEKLKECFNLHLEETNGQLKRLEKISTMTGITLSGKTCKAMQGLIEEAKEVLEKESSNNALIDVALIGAARRIEHYEMAAYCTTRAMAKVLEEDDVEELLTETFDEESTADENLLELLESDILPEAHVTASEESSMHAVSSHSKKSEKRQQSAKN